jgi:hypothetical protein
MVDAVMAWEIPMVLQSYGMAPIYVEQDGSLMKTPKRRLKR